MLIAGGMDVHAEYCWAHFVYADIGEVPERHRRFLDKLIFDVQDQHQTARAMQESHAQTGRPKWSCFRESVKWCRGRDLNARTTKD
jgi:hypothetical protein